MSSGEEGDVSLEPPARYPRGACLCDRRFGCAASTLSRPENVHRYLDSCVLNALNAVGVPVPCGHAGPCI
eukprot:1293642-Pyramimonas_sp.AAC.1